MKASEFNRTLDATRGDLEQDIETLEALYLRLINRVGAQAAKALTSSVRLVTVGAAGWQPPPEGVLFNPEATAGYVTSQFVRTHRRIFRAAADAPLTRAGVEWDITNPFASHLLQTLGARTGVALGEAVQPVIQATIADAYQRGLSVPDTAALISEQVAEAAPAQARMLARTDLNGLANGASTMAASLVGVTYKQWLTAEDDRVRETHAEADGQIVPLDQPFDVGGESLDYPGDPAGSDEETCNCRCTVIYLDQDEGDRIAQTAAMTAAARMASDTQALLRVVADALDRLTACMEQMQAPVVNTSVTVPAARRVQVVRDDRGDIAELLVEDQ